jgi:hypothetical protein
VKAPPPPALQQRRGVMAVERWGPAVCRVSDHKEGKDEMTKASSDLQDPRRRIYVKAKGDTSWRFWGLYVHVCKMETLRAAENCRSALRRCGCGRWRYSTSNCCRRHRFSAISNAFGLESRRNGPRWSGRHTLTRYLLLPF